MSPEGEDVVEKAALVGRTETVHILSVWVVAATALGNMKDAQPKVADIDAAAVVGIDPTAAGTGWVSAIAHCIGRAWNDHTEIGDGFVEEQPVGHAVEVEAEVAAAVDHDVHVHMCLCLYVV